MPTLEQLAAAELIQRAFRLNTPSVAELLINSAKRIDPTIDTDHVKAQWFEKWLPETRNERYGVPGG